MPRYRQFAAEPPAPPAHLTPEQAELFTQAAAFLIDKGAYGRADVRRIGMLCRRHHDGACHRCRDCAKWGARRQGARIWLAGALARGAYQLALLG